jgi:hypothetical protein
MFYQADEKDDQNLGKWIADVNLSDACRSESLKLLPGEIVVIPKLPYP